MKRGWIAVIVFALCIALGGFEYAYVTGNMRYYLRMLDEADEKMTQNQTYDAQSVINRMAHRYHGESPVYNSFMYHCDVEDIAGHLAMLEGYARAGDTAEYLATSALTRFEIENLRDAEYLRFDNIF